MELTNNTTNRYALAPRVILEPSATQTFEDILYYSNTTFRKNIDSLLAHESITMDTPPVGYVIEGNELAPADDVGLAHDLFHGIKVEVLKALFSGVASEQTLQGVLAAVDGLEGFTDGLEGFTDGIEGLLTTIRDNADTVESWLSAINDDQTNGTQKSIVRGGAKGTTSAADVTSRSINANRQALDVNIASRDSGSTTATDNGTGVNVSDLAAVEIVAANTSRRGLIVVNSGSRDVRIRYGDVASATNYVDTLVAGGRMVIESTVVYTGSISAICASNGSTTIRVAEFTE